MKQFIDVLITIVVLGGILAVSAVFTNWFTKRMYYKCAGCGSLNAKRRAQCRICGDKLPS